jgi:ergothioneine biosynthesis protein EgtB
VKERRQPAAPLEARYRSVRALSERLCAPLQPEDYVVQSMPDASPTKWHLAHTSWFFETFVLEASVRDYRAFHPQFRVLFNSYYEAIGPRHARAERGLLTRPTVSEVMAYRRSVDDAMLALLHEEEAAWQAVADRIELGLQHEQQHQELLLTDLQHAFSMNPLKPVYSERGIQLAAAPEPQRYRAFDGGVEQIGFAGAGFAFDNERPRHRVFLEPFELATRLVTAGEYAEFIEEGGYRRPELWLSDGWAAVQREAWQAPLYWEARTAGAYSRYSLHGDVQVATHEPVCHVSFYEADAYARWAQQRLPSEAEWELAYADQAVNGQFVEEGGFVPRCTASGFGSAWVWTSTPYVAYPGFRAEAGAIGEYNGKFMCNQMVLRGGSCFSPQPHLRATYRNFFPPSARWQVTGIRLAR